MDPVSGAFSIAKATGQLSWELYKFSKDVRNNNRAIGDLASELLSLNRAIANINSTLEKPSFRAVEQRASEDSNELWSLVNGNLCDTQYTLKNFEQHVRPLLPEQDNVSKRAMRTLKFGLNQSEINSYRTRIQGHVSILNITMQTLTLRAAYLAPDAILGKVMPAIQELRSLIERRDSITALPPEMVERVKKVRDAAAKEVTSASTIYSGSSHGSVDGHPMTEHQRRATLDWIAEPVVYEDPQEPPPLRAESTITAPSNVRDPSIWSTSGNDESGSAAVTDLTSDSVFSATEEEVEEDPQESFQADLVQKAFQKGAQLFGEKKYPDAQRNLQKGIKGLERLPMKLRDQAQLRNVQMMLAQCACYSPDLDEAERRLTLITREEHAEDPDSAHEDAIRRCQAMHLLSAVLLREGKFTAAKKYCNTAIVGRRKLLGKEDIRYYESVYLLAQIAEADGTEDGQTDAELYLEMIPDDIRPKLVKVVDEYPMTPALQPMSPPSISPMAQRADEGPESNTTLPSPSLPPTDHLASFNFTGLGEPAVIAPEEPRVSFTSSPEIRPRPPPSPKSLASGFDERRELHLPSRFPPTPDVDRERKSGMPDETKRMSSQPQPDHPPDYFHARSGSEADVTPPPPLHSPAARTPSVVSDISSAASAEGDERRRSSWKGLFSRRRSSNSKPASSPKRPARTRVDSTPGGATGAHVSPLLQPSKPAQRAASVGGPEVPQSLEQYLLERIAEENGHRPRTPEYPGLF